MMISRRCLALSGLLALLLGAGAGALPAQTPHPNAHSHNDYFRKHPLEDALRNGFGSVEADIFLVNGRLLVSHELSHTSPDRTLESMYLDPLRERCRTNGGQVYRGGRNDFHLLIDIKADATGVYGVLGPMLARYHEMFTRFTPTNFTPGAITVVLSGDRPTELVAAEPERWCGIDGRPDDLARDPKLQLVPWISESWKTVFGGFSGNQLSTADRQKLRDITRAVHQQGRKLRFWDTPDRPAMWRELRDGGVDLLNADDLPGLAAFLEGRPAPKTASPPDSQ